MHLTWQPPHFNSDVKTLNYSLRRDSANTLLLTLRRLREPEFLGKAEHEDGKHQYPSRQEQAVGFNEQRNQEIRIHGSSIPKLSRCGPEMSLARDFSVFLQNAFDGMKAVRAADSWAAQFLFHARQPVLGGAIKSAAGFFGAQGHALGVLVW